MSSEAKSDIPDTWAVGSGRLSNYKTYNVSRVYKHMLVTLDRH